MKIIQRLFLYFCILFSCALNAQQSYFQELEKNIETPTNDSLYIKSLYYLSWSQLHKDTGQAAQYANSLYSYAKSVKSSEALRLAYDCKAQMALNNQDYEQVEFYIDSLYLLNKQRNLQLANAVYHHSMGHLFDFQSRQDSAVYHWDIALRIYQDLDMIKYATAMKVNIGSALYLTSYKEEELSQLAQESEKVWTRSDSIVYAEELNKLGRVFLDLANFAKAKHYIGLGLELAKQLEDRDLQSDLTLNLGEIHFFQGDFTKALSYYAQSRAYKKQEGRPCGYESFKMGRASLELKEHEQAIHYLNIAIEDLARQGEEYALVDAYGFLTDAYYEMGEHQKALEAVVQLEEMYAQIEEGERLSDFHKKIIESSFITHNKQAKEYFTFLREQETVAQMYEVESAFQLEKKETEILLLNQKNEIARKNRYVLVLIVVLVLLILLIILQRNRTLAKSKRIVELENKYKNVELQQSKLLLSKKKDDFSDLVNNLNDLKGDLSTQKFNQLVSSLKTAKVVEKNWEDYISSFEKLNPYFFEQLKQRAIKLTASEKRLCALIHQGMTISDIAHVLNLQKKSVESARYRLRKKFQLQAQDNLQEFIKKLCKANK